MIVISIDRNKYNACSYVYPCLPTAERYKLPSYKDADKEWKYVRLANGTKSYVPRRYDCSDNEWLNLPFWDVLDKYNSSKPNVICSDRDIKQTLLAEYDVCLSYIPLTDILEIFVQTQEKADILLSEDKKGILKDKIVVDDWRYLI